MDLGTVSKCLQQFAFTAGNRHMPINIAIITGSRTFSCTVTSLSVSGECNLFRVDGWECLNHVKLKYCLLNGTMTLCCSGTVLQQFYTLTVVWDGDLPAVVCSFGPQNGFQGHVTSRFKGQGSDSPDSPSPP